MQEVLTRRYGRALESEGEMPDLILLDGGRGQLGAGLKALEGLGLDSVPGAALAKRAEEVYTPDRLDPLLLDTGSPPPHAPHKIPATTPPLPTPHPPTPPPPPAHP